MTARTRISSVALAVSIALGHASAVFAASQPPKADTYGMRAIIGGDVSADAIIGGDNGSDAIIGGDVRANAIIGGDVSADAIIGGDRQKSKRAIIGGDLDSMLARGVVAYGPIESLDPAKGLVVVLGQTFRFGGTADQMTLLKDRIAIGETILATVSGTVDSRGALRVKAMSLSDRQYVPGSTSVMVVGKVRTVDASLGAIAIGSLQVDYSAALAAGNIQFVQGQMVAIIGVQTAQGMPLTASSIKAL